MPAAAVSAGHDNRRRRDGAAGLGPARLRPRLPRAASSSATSPISRRGRVGCTWPPYWTAFPRKWSATQWPTICGLHWSPRPCKWRPNNIGFTKGETIFHSDRGTQYLSAEFASVAASLGVRRSVGRTGCCYCDNACAESFNGTLKNERVHRTSYPTREHARIDITRYIELRYNQIRLHSTLGYRTPK